MTFIKRGKQVFTTILMAILLAFLCSFSIQAAENSGSEYEGIGIFLSKSPAGYIVEAIIKSSPSEGKVSLGDIVESIDGYFTAQRNINEIRKLIEKKAGESVKLTILRQGQRLTINLKAERIVFSPDKIVGKLPLNTTKNDNNSNSGKIHSFETTRRFFCKNITKESKYNTGDIFTIKRDGKDVGTAKLSQIYDYGVYFTQIDGEALNQISRNKYNIVFLKEAEYSQRIPENEPETQNGDRKCYECNAPLRRGIKVEGKLHCNKCARNLCDVCWCCSQWREKGDGENIYSNMFVCNICLDKVWESDSLLETLYRKVQFMMEKEWGVQLTASPNISSANLRKGILGLYATHRDKIFINKKQKFLIIMGTIAHEHAHAWQNRNNPRLKNMVLIEGFASWVEYHFYKLMKQEELGRRLLESSPDYYKQGFQLMKNVEKEHGFKYVFRLISVYKEEE